VDPTNSLAIGSGGGSGYWGGASGVDLGCDATAGAGGSGGSGGCIATATAFNAGLSGTFSGQALIYPYGYNSLNPLYITGAGLGGLPGTSTSTSSNGNGGNGLVVITPVSTLAPFATPIFYTGATYTYTVPAGTSNLLIKMWGAGPNPKPYDSCRLMGV